MNYRKLIFLVLIALAWGCCQAIASVNMATQPTAGPVADEPEGKTASDPDIAGIPMIDYNTPKPYIINDITVHGVKYLDTNILTASSGLMKGETVYIPGNQISQAVSRLWSQRYFSDVKVIADILGDSVNLEIYLQERPRVYRWAFEGIRKGEATTLTEDLKLKRGTELSDYVIDKNIILIKKHFSQKGFRNAEVTPRIENDSVIQNAVNVTFVVDKKNRVKIGELDFEGNEEFTDGRLRRTMKKTHRKSINFFQSSKLKDDEYLNDKENIIDFYNSRGYRNAVIVKDSMYVINDKRIGINITLEEGNQYYIRDINWVGNTLYPTEFLSAMLAIEKGDIYDKKAIDKRLGIGKEENPEDMGQIKSLYQNQGYLMSMIDPVEIIIGEDSIDLDIKIFEGKPFTINNVDISGNMRVNDEVIRRDIYTRPGELYNRALIMRTLRELAGMQHFDPQAIAPNIVPVSNELVDVSWSLTEMASDKFEISGGWGAGMFVGSVGVQLNNVSMKDFFKKGAWRPYPHGQNQQLVVRAQTNGSYYKSFMGSFTEPWLGGKKPNSLTISAHFSEENNAYNFGGSWVSEKTKHFRTTGLAAGIGRRLSWPDPYFTLYNEIGYQAYNLLDWDYFILRNGRANILTLRTVLARSTVNQPIYPSSGSEFMLSLTLTPPYSLFDKKDYKEMKEYVDLYDAGLLPNADSEKYDRYTRSRYKWIEYHKWQGRFAWYLPLTRDQKLVLMTKAEIGYLGHYNAYKVSPFEGFDVGGDGMSGYNIYGVDIVALRGYEDGSLTPRAVNSTTGFVERDYAKVYNKYTVELRYPIVMQPQSQIYALAFAEGGNAYMSWSDFDPFTIKRSLGVGVRLYLPIVGLIGVDWGYGFDKPVGSNTRNGGKFHFMMGMQF